MELETLYDLVVQGQVDGAVEAARAALEDGKEPGAILNEALVPAMDKVGQLFESGEYFLPEMLASGLAMKSCMNELAPELAKRGDVKPLGRVALGTVKGDVHDIGKNLVGVMLEGAGFEIEDLGFDVPREKFVAAAEEADILGLSGMVSTTIPEMGNVIKALQKAGKRDKVMVMVGGAPVSQQFADSIGADGYARDAAMAVRKAKELLGVE
jgi:5-methyltetrahydrofolate--homocysteine methyltransferase